MFDSDRLRTSTVISSAPEWESNRSLRSQRYFRCAEANGYPTPELGERKCFAGKGKGWVCIGILVGTDFSKY